MKKLLPTLVFLFIATGALAWTEPGSSAPSGNVAAPLRTESDPSVLTSVKDGVSWSELMGGTWKFGNPNWGPGALEVHNNIWNGSANDNYGTFAAGHGYFYGGLDIGTSNGNDASAGQIIATGKIQGGSLCIGTDCRTSWPSTASLSWASITGKPAGFADDTDDVGSAPTWASITGKPAGFADDTDNGITSESDPSVQANVKDGVAWGELSGIPAGFADGTDNDTDTTVWSKNGTTAYYTAGNVGIGTSEPYYKFQVSGGDLAVYNVGSSEYVSLGSDGQISAWGTGGSSAWIKYPNGSVQQIVSGGANGYAYDINASSAGVGGLKITSSGTSGLNVTAYGATYGTYTTNTNTSGSSYALWCQSQRSDTGGCAGNKNWTYSSDERLKKNIETVKSGLDKVLKLRGVTFNWKTDEKSEHTNLGFIAQEVLKVVPEVVTKGPDGYYMIEGGSLNAVLVEAVKELKAENDDLKARIEALEAKIK